jgi:tetratricopeptide (TPR) repeat protein|tara:strand:+ start:37420 stop:37923 length:504 start_codon:yes stop_codon:yes gene_type:complete
MRPINLVWIITLFSFLNISDSIAQFVDPQKTIVGGSGNEFLSAASFAIIMGQYDEGIRLTHLGLTRYGPSRGDRAAALSNLCAAHAAKGEPDTAIPFCDESMDINGRNWRAFVNRAYSYYLKNMLSEATSDLDSAASLRPDARQVIQLRGMINERGLLPRVIMEDHQ